MFRTFIFDSNNKLLVKGDITIDDGTSNYIVLQSDSNDLNSLRVNGNTKVTSNVYVLNKLGVGTSNPTERVDVIDNLKASSNLYVMNWIGAGNSNPTERIDIVGNSKVRSNLYILSNLSISHSNPTEKLDINGNAKVSSNVYVMSKIGINTSNPAVGLEVNTTDAVLVSKGTTAQRPSVPVLGHVRYNTDNSQFEGFGAGNAWGSLGGVKSTNQQTYVSAEEYPTSNDDNIRFFNSNIESMRITRQRLVGINTSNPTERLDIIGNTKVSSNIYILNRVGVNTSNPAVGLEVNTTDAVLVSKGTTAQRPSVPVLGHVRYNTDNSQFEGFGAGNAWGSLGGVKSTNQQTYVSAEEYPTSNDDNIRFFNSNIESMRITRQRLVGINTSNPSERVDIVGNTKVSSNVYVLNRVGINTSNPAVGLEVNTTDAVLVSKGTTAQRPSVPVLGHVRYNTDNSQFEGFGAGNAWGSLGGVKSTNQQTYVSAEEYPTSNDDNIRFFNSNIESMRITRQRLVGINTSNPSERVDIVGNTKISSNIYVLNRVGVNTSNPAVGLEVNTTDAVLVSKGTTAQRPSVPVLGHVRYNTDNSQFEGFGAGNAWGSLGGVKSTNQQTYVSAEEYPTSNDDNIRFFNSNIESMRITRQRLVGINTSNPSERVDIVGNVKISSNEYVMGNVGIGTSNPAYKLDVVGEARVQSNLYIGMDSVSTSGTYTTGKILFGGPAGDTGYPNAQIAVRRFSGTGETSELVIAKFNDADIASGPDRVRIRAAAIAFDCYSNAQGPTNTDNDFAASNIRMYIMENGNVGIGTTTPSSQLEVIGDAKTTTITTSNVSTSNLSSSNMRTCNLDVNTISASNIVTSNLVIVNSNISTNNITAQETVVSSNIYTSNLYSSRRVGVGTQDPQYTLEVQGDVYVTGPSILSNSLKVTGPMTLCNSLNVSGATLLSNSLTTYGATTLSNTVTISGATTLSNTLNVSGATLFSNALTTYNGTTTHSNAVIVSGITTLSNNLNVSGPMTLCNTMNVAGATLLSNTLLTYGATTLSNILNISGATTLSNTLNVSGATLLSNALTTYNGTTTHSNAVIVSGITTLSNNLNVSGPMTLCNSMNVAGSALLSNILLVYGATTLSNTVTVSGATSLSNTLNVYGASLLSNTLTTYNGTTTHSNAVIVSGITTLSNNLNVSGPMTLCNSMNVAGAALLSNTLLTYGATTLSNTLTISGATTLSNTLNVSGATLLSNALTTYNGTTTHSNDVIISGVTTLSNDLDVSGPMTLCNTINVAGAALLSNTLLTYGTTTLSNTLTISGATTLSNTLNVSGATLLSNALTTYNGTTTHSNAVIVSGITTLSNNLNVSGPMTLCNSMNVSGAALLSNTLLTYGATTLSNTVRIAGATTLSNTLNVSGATLLSNALTTYNGTTTHSNNVIISGVTTLSNELDVSGAMTLCNTINVSGAALLSNTLLTYGATTLSNTLTISGATTLSNTLNVSGVTLLSNALTTYNGTTTHSNAVVVSGITTLSNNLNVSGPMTLCNSMNVAGAALLSNTLLTYGATTLSNTLTVSGATTLSNTLQTFGVTTFSSNVFLLGPTSLSNSLNVSGATTLSNILLTYGATTLSNNVTIAGATLLSNALTTYNGTTTHSNAVIVSGITTLSNNLNVSGPMTLCNTINVSGAALLSNTVTTYGATTLSNTLTVSGATTLSNTLDVSGATTLSNGLTVYNGTSTLSNNTYISGNVGIGTSSTNAKLDVRGAIYIDGAVGQYPTASYASKKEFIRFGTTDGANDMARIYGEGATDAGKLVIAIQDNADASEALIIRGEKHDGTTRDNMVVRNDGLVGIGTSSMTEKLQVASGKIYSDTQLLGNSNDSASVPSFSFKEDSNTGMYHPSNDAIGFTTNGSEKMRIDTNGNVGIGTTTPTEKVEIVGTTKVTSNMYVMSKLGVGTSNISTACNFLLHVAGDTRIDGNLDVTGIFSVTNTDVKLTDQFTISNNGTGPGLKVYQMGANHIADFYDDATLALRVADGGSVGIKTGTPTEVLDVVGNTKVSGNTYVMTQLGVGTSNLLYTLDVAGTQRTTGATMLSNTLLVYGASTFSNNTTTTGVATVNNNLNVSGVSTLLGGSKIIVQGGVDGGSNVGIFTWSAADTNWGIYTAQPGAGKSLANGTAVAGAGMTNHATRLRVADNSAQGIVFENSSDKLLMSVRGGDGYTFFSSNVGLGTSNWTERLQVAGKIHSDTQVLGTSNDTVSRPSFSFKEDSNTGIYHPTGTSTIAITTGGTERLRIDNAGNVGIATTGATEKLQVTGKIYSDTQVLATTNDSVSVPSFSFKENSNTGMYHAGTDAIGITTGGTERVRVDNVGNVGIGVSPTTTLDVNGSMLLRNGNSLGMYSSNQLMFAWNNGSNYKHAVKSRHNSGADNTQNAIDFYLWQTSQLITDVGNKQVMSITSPGVGIFNSNPAYSLDVTGTINSTGNVTGPTITSLSNLGMFSSNTAISASNTTISLSNYVYGTNTTNITNAQTTANWASNTAISASNTTISLSNYVYGTNTTNITNAQTTANWASNSGLFGSNTAVWSSNNLFNKAGGTISGNVVVTGTTALSNTVTLFATSGGAAATMVMNSTSGSGGRDYRIISTLTGNAGGAGAFQIYDQTAPATRLHIDSNGRVGIGTTTPAQTLDVSGTINSSGNITGPTITSLSNLGIFSSNTAISASNTTISLSNYVYGTNTTNITAAQTTANWASNVGLWSSNNLVKKSGDTMTGNLDISGNGGIMLSAIYSSMVLGENAALSVGKAKSTNNIANVRYSHSADGSTNNYVGIGFWGNDDLVNIKASGNVGIGTTNPVSRLHINNPTANNSNNIVFEVGTTADSGNVGWGTINFNGYYSNGEQRINTNKNRWRLTTDQRSTTDKFIIDTYNGTSTTTALSILTNGYVGINTLTPSTNLDVNGTINATDYTGTRITSLSNLGVFGSNTAVSASNTAIWSSNNLLNKNTGGTISGAMTIFGNVTVSNATFECSNLSIKRDGDDVLVIDVNEGSATMRNVFLGDDMIVAGACNVLLQTYTNVWNTRLYVHNNGNVGIGTTNPQYLLDVNGSSCFSSTVSIKSNLNVSGGVANTADATFGNMLVASYNKSLGATALNFTNICTLTMTNGAATVYLDVVHSQTSSSEAKSYIIPISYFNTTTSYYSLLPISSTGPYSGTDWTVELNPNAGVNTLRLVRLSGTNTANFTCTLRVHQSAVNTVSIGDSSTTGTGATNIGVYDATQITQVDGNVGVGLSNPSYKLDVNGDINFTGTFRQNGTPYIGSQWSNNSSNVFLFGSNVGLGLSNPSYSLDVVGTTRTTGQLLVPGGSNCLLLTNGDPGDMVVKAYGTAGDRYGMGQYNAGITRLFTSSTYSGSIRLSAPTNDVRTGTATFTDYLTVLAGTNANAGNVGIGTSTPSSALDVNGTVRIGGGGSDTSSHLHINTTDGDKIRLTNLGSAGSKITHTAGWSTNFLAGPGTSASGILTFQTSTASGWSERMRVANDGSVGIGTSAPTERLQVSSGKIYSDTQLLGNSNDSLTTPSFSFKENSNTGIFHPCNDTVGFVAGGVEALRASSYNTTITSNLTVGSNIVANGNITMNNRLVVSTLKINRKSGIDVNVTSTSVRGFSNVSTGIILDVGSNAPASGQSMRVTWSNNTELMRITGDGNVGIATNSPVHRLELNGNMMVASNNSFISMNANNAVASFGMIKKSGVSPSFAFTSNYLNTTVANSMRFEMISGIHLSNMANETPVEYMRITPVGNVGIGTTAPAYKLHVSSNASTNGTLISVDNPNTGTGGWAAVSVRNSGSQTLGGMRMGMLGTGWTNSGIYQQNGGFLECDQSNGISIAASSNTGTLRFYAGGTTEAMRINSNQNVGIGTISPSYKLDVQGIVGITNAGGKKLQFANDATTNRHIVLYENTNNEHQYYGFGVNSDTLRYQVDANGRHVFFCGTSSTTSTELMRIQGNGNVGIGVQNPSSKLEVNGTIKCTNLILPNNVWMTSADNRNRLYFGIDARNYYSSMDGHEFRNSSDGTLMLLTNAGNLGIGTSSPSYKLDVVGKTRIQAPSSSNILSIQTDTNAASQVAGIMLGIPSGQGATIESITQTGNVTDLRFWTTPYNLVSVTSNIAIYLSGSNNLVGIGTSSPACKLDVAGRINTYIAGGETTYTPYVTLTNNATTANLYMRNSNLGIDISNIGNNQTFNKRHLIINEYADGTCGFVGIGTDTPSYKLDVNGNTKVATSSTTTGLIVQRSDVSTIVGNTAGGGNYGSIQVRSGGTSSTVGSSAYALYLQPDGGNIFTGSGNVGIGTTSPTYKLDITGAQRIYGSAPRLTLESTQGAGYNVGIDFINYAGQNPVGATINVIDTGSWGSHMAFYTKNTGSSSATTPERMRITADGNVGIGTTSPSYKLHVSGDIYATGNVTAYSDMRAKSNLDVITEPLYKVSQLTGYTYDMIDNPDLTTKITPRFTGIIAQDLEKVLPEAVHKDTDGKYSVSYGNMAGLFVESIKELVKENTELKNKVSTLEERLEALERLIGSF